jgi:ribosomal protein L40E
MERRYHRLRRYRLRDLKAAARGAGIRPKTFARLATWAAALLAACGPSAVAAEYSDDYVVCPECHALNPPDAAYCMGCGARLNPEEEWAAATRVPAFTVAPLACFDLSLIGPGFSCRGNAGRCGYGLSYQFFPVSVPDDMPFYWTTEDDVHRLRVAFAFSLGARKRVKPYLGAALDARYQHIASNHYGQYGVYEHEFAVAAEVAVGINLTYTARGSDVELGLSLGPGASWEYGPGTGIKYWNPATSFRAVNVTYVTPNVGVWAELATGTYFSGYPRSGTAVAAGPAFAW